MKSVICIILISLSGIDNINKLFCQTIKLLTTIFTSLNAVNNTHCTVYRHYGDVTKHCRTSGVAGQHKE